MARKTRKKTAAKPAPRRQRKTRAKAGGPLKWHWRYSLAVVAAGIAALAWMSLLSYNPTDPPASVVTIEHITEQVIVPATSESQPSSRPGIASAPTVDMTPRVHSVAVSRVKSSEEISNAAGVVGAYTAHGLLWSLGGASCVGLAFVTIGALGLAIHGRIRSLPLRTGGVCLLMAATAAGAFLLESDGSSGSALGPPGLLGSSVGGFLQSQFAQSGGWIIVAMAAIVGVIMTAGRLIFIPLRLCKRAWLAVSEKIREMIRESRERRAAQDDPEPKEAAPASISTPIQAPAAQTPEHLGGDRRAIVAEITRILQDRAGAQEARSTEPQGPELPSGPGYEEDFELPALELLAEAPEDDNESEQAEATRRCEVIRNTLTAFGVDAEVVDHQVGPVVTLIELSLAPGVKVSRVTALSEDIARALATPSVRIVSPLPGRDTIGIELPNKRRQVVRIRGMLAPDAVDPESMELPVCLGKDAGGESIVADLASMPHLLIAGTTGSGKSVCINAMLLSLMVMRRPTEVRLVLVDPKMVEMAVYDGIPHILCPPVSDMSRAAGILEWATDEMDKRYALLRDARVRHISEFNELDEEERRRLLGVETPQPQTGENSEQAEQTPPVSTRMPYYVVVVDELADLIMTASKDVEGHIIRIAQKARAVGIHLVLATQRPSVKVVTGLIKANMPCRISFRVASRVESRIILDQNGAESLVGKGDMLLLKPGQSLPVRAQGVFVDGGEIRAVVNDLCDRSTVIHHPDLVGDSQGGAPVEDSPQTDDLLPQAAEAVVSADRGSAALVQRRLKISYAQARDLVNELTDLGVLGPARGSQARQCLITADEWLEISSKV